MAPALPGDDQTSKQGNPKQSVGTVLFIPGGTLRGHSKQRIKQITMSNPDWNTIPDNTPIIVAAGQYTEALDSGEFSSPAELLARAARAALADAGVDGLAGQIDTIALIRTFHDSPGAWSCPFGGSNNLPESLAQRIGATPERRIYSGAGGNEPLSRMAELMTRIAAGEIQLALLGGSEAIANERHAQRQQKELDWNEEFDVPLDDRQKAHRMAHKAELNSGMYLPAHFYALIENRQGHLRGESKSQLQHRMAGLLAPMSEVASRNPYAFRPRAYSAAELASTEGGNYPLVNPYLKRMVAQDAVNLAAVVIITSAGKARELGIPTSQWIFPHAYSQGEERFLIQREDPSRSVAMEMVIADCLDQAGMAASDMTQVDIYSCFPCAVEAARRPLQLPADGSIPLTVTGGLPFFGGPGNNYSMHALAEMAHRLRNGQGNGLITANGGMLSKHAAVVLANQPPGAPFEAHQIDEDSIPEVPVAENAAAATVLTHTVIYLRDQDDLGMVLAETDQGERLMASSTDPATTAAMDDMATIGRRISVTPAERGFNFGFAD
jgi:acetyl-CoA C-acetyltransferase